MSNSDLERLLVHERKGLNIPELREKLESQLEKAGKWDIVFDYTSNDDPCLFSGQKVLELVQENKQLKAIIDEIKNPNNFVKWQKKCVCDFIEPRNNNSHSLSCMERYNVILEKLQTTLQTERKA